MRSVLGLAAAAVLAACGAPDSGGRVAFAPVEVQAYLEAEVARTLPGLTVGTATCPARLPSRVGVTAVCTVVVEQVALDYEVQRLVGDRFEARPARPVVIIAEVSAAVKAKLGAEATSVRCGEALVAQPASGQPLTCQVSGPRATRTAVVRVGADGTLAVTDT